MAVSRRLLINYYLHVTNLFIRTWFVGGLISNSQINIYYNINVCYIRTLVTCVINLFYNNFHNSSPNHIIWHSFESSRRDDLNEWSHHMVSSEIDFFFHFSTLFLFLVLVLCTCIYLSTWSAHRSLAEWKTVGYRDQGLLCLNVAQILTSRKRPISNSVNFDQGICGDMEIFNQDKYVDSKLSRTERNCNCFYSEVTQ